MNQLLNARTWIVAGLLALVATSSLFMVSEREFTLSDTDLFFAITTVISLGFNLWQWFRDKYKYTPLKNSLIGLFNDIKGRQLRAFQRQELIASNVGMSLSLDNVRL